MKILDPDRGQVSEVWTGRELGGWWGRGRPGVISLGQGPLHSQTRGSKTKDSY